MFGDYFKSLSTNQKIMFGVAVFLVVCVIVYLLYKYLFKAAKNFIQNFILTKREKFETINIVLKSKCDANQFYNGTQCSNLPPDTVVRAKRKNANNADILRTCLSNDGKRVIDYECKDGTAPNFPTPTARNNTTQLTDSLTINPASLTNSPFLVGLTTNPINNLGSAVISTTVAGNTVAPNSTIPFQLGFTYTAPGATSNPDLNAIKVSTFSDALTTADKIYYSYGTPNVDSSAVVSGTMNYLIPIKLINYYPPQHNIRDNIQLCREGVESIGQSTCTDLSDEMYNNANNNNSRYINFLKSNHDTHLKAIVAKILSNANINLFRNLDNAQTVPNIFSLVSGIMLSADFEYKTFGGRAYLQVTNVGYTCGDNNLVREVTTLDCSGNSSVTSVRYIPNGINASSLNMTLDAQNGNAPGTFSNICIWNQNRNGTIPQWDNTNSNWRIVGTPGSCTAKNCTLYSTTSFPITQPYNGFMKPFTFTVSGSTIFSSFVAGQDIYLPENLLGAGSRSNTPETYVISTQWNITVNQDPDLLGQWCSDRSLVASAIDAYEKTKPTSQRLLVGDNFQLLNTDEVRWTRGSNVVRVTRKVYQQYDILNPSSWGIYYIYSDNEQPTMERDQGRTANGIFIGAKQKGSSNALAPSAVPIFQWKETLPDSFDAARNERTSSLSVERNIWVGLYMSDIYDNAGFANQVVKASIQTLFTNFAALIPGRSTTITNITGIDFSGASSNPAFNKTISELKWGFAVNDTSNEVRLTFNEFAYAIPTAAVTSRTGGTLNLAAGSSNIFFIDRDTRQIEWVTNAFSDASQPAFNSTNNRYQNPTNTSVLLYKAANDLEGYAIIANTNTFEPLNNPGLDSRDIYPRLANGTWGAKYSQALSSLATSRRWVSLDCNNTPLARRVIAVSSDGNIVFSNNGGTSWNDIGPVLSTATKISLPSITIQGKTVNAQSKFTKVMFGSRNNSVNTNQDIYFTTAYESVKTVENFTKVRSANGMTGTLIRYTQTDTNTSSTQTNTETITITSTSGDLWTRLNTLIPDSEVPTAVGSSKSISVENFTSIGGYLYRAVLTINNNVVNAITVTQITGHNVSNRYDLSDFVVKVSVDAAVGTNNIFISGTEYNGSILRWRINSSTNVISPISYTSSSPFQFLGGKWRSIDMSDDMTVSIGSSNIQIIAGQYQVACSDFLSSDVSSLSENDGRIIYSEDFGNTWREVTLPIRNTADRVTSPVSPIPPVGATQAQITAAKFYYNPVNFTSVMFCSNNGSSTITRTRDLFIATYGPYRPPTLNNNVYINHTQSQPVDTTTNPAPTGLLRVKATARTSDVRIVPQ
jgi:hypothetical protein